MADYYSITQLTREFDISTRTLRFYEDEGLIKPDRRGRTRLYSPSDRSRIIKILTARRVGFTLAEISDMLKLESNLPGDARLLRAAMERVEHKRAQLREQRRDLESIIDDLDHLEDACLARLAELGVGT